MESVTIDDLIKLVETYNSEEKEVIKRAYLYAYEKHKGQYRQSGEEYITHPLNVAYILATMHADRDTIIGGLLHDTLEDTNTTKREIRELFGSDVAKLVDGVTKLSKMNFSSKEERNLANTRKIITGITQDVRIIIIKLADRLHNMRTLQFKSEFKQKENALETLDIFVPLAYYIGAQKLKNELEDLAFSYLKPDVYKRIEEQRLSFEEESEACIKEMLYYINSILSKNDIPATIKYRTKHIYALYKQIVQGNKINDIHDLIALKVIVEEVKDCYLSLGLIHSIYHPINSRFKDFICNPKTNMYQSLHTTVFGPDDRLVQTQIRTYEMESVNNNGLTSYWDISKGQARKEMQRDLRNKYQFFKSLSEINKVFTDNKEFVNQVKDELFGNRIYVYTTKGDVIELPAYSTPIDFAYKIHSEVGNKMVKAFVNDEEVALDTVLNNKDRVRILTDEESSGPKLEWVNKAHTTTAKRKILEGIRK